MNSFLATQCVFILAVVFGGVNAGPVQSCQQQLLNIVQTSVNLSVFTPSCLHSTIPQLDSQIKLLLNSNDSCLGSINAMQSIIVLLKARLSQNTSLCGVNLQTLTLLNSQIQVNLLGLLTVGVTLSGIQIQGLTNLDANVSLIALSPTTLRVDVFLPLLINANVQAKLGLLGLGVNVNLGVVIQASSRVSLLVTINAGGDIQVAVDTVIAAVNDYDCPNSGLSSLLSLGGALSVVSTVVTALVNSVGVVLGSILSALLTSCTTCITCVAG